MQYKYMRSNYIQIGWHLSESVFPTGKYDEDRKHWYLAPYWYLVIYLWKRTLYISTVPKRPTHVPANDHERAFMDMRAKGDG